MRACCQIGACSTNLESVCKSWSRKDNLNGERTGDKIAEFDRRLVDISPKDGIQPSSPAGSSSVGSQGFKS